MHQRACHDAQQQGTYDPEKHRPPSVEGQYNSAKEQYRRKGVKPLAYEAFDQTYEESDKSPVSTKVSYKRKRRQNKENNGHDLAPARWLCGALFRPSGRSSTVFCDPAAFR